YTPPPTNPVKRVMCINLFAPITKTNKSVLKNRDYNETAPSKWQENRHIKRHRQTVPSMPVGFY
ncbi:MAG: hypothetical protein SPH43_07205, partial [Candidatus Enteromonas sp.]|nr:hypothetical protein [Candidatus Enteromonas sp.]